MKLIPSFSATQKMLVGLSLLGVTGFVNAGTMGPVVEPSPWSGVYVGLNGGAAWWESQFTWSDFGTGYFAPVESVITPYSNTKLKHTGFIGGGQLGTNVQISNYLIGIEADFDYVDLNVNRNVLSPVSFALSVSPSNIIETVSTDWLSTIRARLGYLKNNLLVYGTGGFAIAKIQYTDQMTFLPPTAIPGSAYQSQQKVESGWTAGGGVEWKFASHWSAKAEYLYVDFGSTASTSNLVTTTGALIPLATIRHDHDLTANIARVGVNYSWS